MDMDMESWMRVKGREGKRRVYGLMNGTGHRLRIVACAGAGTDEIQERDRRRI